MLAISALGIQGINELIMFSGSIYGRLSSKGYKAIARAITYFRHRIILYRQGRAFDNPSLQAIGTGNQPIIMEIAVLESGQ